MTLRLSRTVGQRELKSDEVLVRINRELLPALVELILKANAHVTAIEAPDGVTTELQTIPGRILFVEKAEFSTGVTLPAEHALGDEVVIIDAFGMSERHMSDGEDWRRIDSFAGQRILYGSGVPTGVIAAPVGSLYMNTSGGAGNTLWVKEGGGTGTGGWVAK